VSLGTHPVVRLDEGDTVIFSSRAIPGNERAVFDMINDLLRLGVRVHHRSTDPAVHTSGHPGRSELERMIALVRPRCFLPVHGTLHHLERHAALAKGLGIEKVAVIENGTPAICDGETLRTEPPVRYGKISVAKGGEPLSDDALRARAELGRSGIVVVAVTLDRSGAADVRVVARGVPAVAGDDAAVRRVEREAARALASFREGKGLTLEEFERRAVRREIEELSGTRPVDDVLVTRVEA
jgi:ribonuclease J